jgi:hypothetical protein
MSNQITYYVDGLDSEGGHIRADEFADRIGYLLEALNGIDRIIGDSPTPKLYYRVVQLSHSSPAKLTIEAVVKRGTRVPADYVTQCRSKFFRDLKAIRTMSPEAEDIDLDVLEDIQRLVFGVGQDFKAAGIENGEYAVELDHQFENNVKKLTGEEDNSYGSLEGKLETANIHGNISRFWIYPTVGAQKVRCDFLPGSKIRIREALGEYVRVEGLKFFRASSDFPFRIKVRDFEVISVKGAVPLERLRGIAPDATEGISSVEFIRRIRDEWAE